MGKPEKRVYRKGIYIYIGEEAEVTDLGVCLRQCAQQAANLRLGFESPNFWVCLHSRSQEARVFIINAIPGESSWGHLSCISPRIYCVISTRLNIS